jgi:aspartate/methionine/tyrosine aminotransferase
LEKDISDMTDVRRIAGSEYMRWAKLHSTAKYNLATSGMAGISLASLGMPSGELEINGDNGYGYRPLLQAIAQRYRVPEQCVVTAAGTSFANYLALAAITELGDEVLIERPCYDPLLCVARYLGLSIRRFRRAPEQDFAIDVEDLERNLSSRTRVIVLCNLHNPSGALTPEAQLREIAALARKVGAYVFVDEVYREMLFEAEPGTAFHIDPDRFIITDSLTKAYGLSGLRCGWIVASEKLADRMWQIHDIHAGTNVYPAEQMSVAAFARLAEIAADARRNLEESRRLLRNFLSGRDDLDFFWPEFGTVVFPRLIRGSVDDLCNLLHSDFETSVVPGRFFEYPDRFRIGVGFAPSAVRESLDRLGQGLERYSAVNSTGTRA